MKKQKKIQFFELEDRFCPICGEFIQKGSNLHYCDDKKINQWNIQRRKKERLQEDDEPMEEIRTYDDKLNEFDLYFNPETYFDYNEDDLDNV